MAYKLEIYKPPRAGDPDSADPHFRPKRRSCGKCGSGFWTTVARRYYCTSCWDRTKFQQKDVSSISVAGGYGYGPRTFGVDE